MISLWITYADSLSFRNYLCRALILCKWGPSWVVFFEPALINNMQVYISKLNCIFWIASNKYRARVQERNMFGSCPGQHSLAAPINDLLCSWHQEHQAASTPKEEESTKLQAALVLCPTTQLCSFGSQEHNCFGQLHITAQWCSCHQNHQAVLLNHTVVKSTTALA